MAHAVVSLVLVLCMVRVVFSDGTTVFDATFDDTTFSASTGSQSQFASALKGYFSWGELPLFSQFQSFAGPSTDAIGISFAFGSTDPSANQLQKQYEADLVTYLSNDPNATMLKGSLRDQGIIMFSLASVAETPSPSAGNGGSDESFVEEYYPAFVVGGIVVAVSIIGAIVVVVMRRRATYDDRLFDTMEAMIDAEDGGPATRGAEGITGSLPEPKKRSQNSNSGTKIDPTQQPAAAPPPVQSV